MVLQETKGLNSLEDGNINIQHVIRGLSLNLIYSF